MQIEEVKFVGYFVVASVAGVVAILHAIRPFILRKQGNGHSFDPKRLDAIDDCINELESRVGKFESHTSVLDTKVGNNSAEILRVRDALHNLRDEFAGLKGQYDRDVRRRGN